MPRATGKEIIPIIKTRELIIPYTRADNNPVMVIQNPITFIHKTRIIIMVKNATKEDDKI
jgi:hypothetical protein